MILGDYEKLNKLWLFPYYNTSANYRDHMLLLSYDDVVKYVKIIGINPIFYNIDLAETLTFTSEPNALYYNIDGEDVMLVSSATDGMFTFKPANSSQLLADAPKIISICRHYERVFAIEEGKRNKLVFSANLDPTNWDISIDDAGYIEIIDDRGCLQKVVSFNDYVYIFKEYGISRLSAYGDQTEFNVSHLFISSVKLYGETVTVCGNKILLLAKDGIHSFDGYSTKKLNLGIDSLFEGVSNECANGLYYNNKYYLACRLNFNDGEKIGCENYEGGYKNNALIELDLSTNEISITRGVDIASMVVLEGENFSKVAVCFNGEHSKKIGELNKSGCVFGQALSKKWVSPKSNMGYPTKVKQIKECFIKTKGPCKIKICTDKQTKEFNVMPKEVSQRIKLGMTGEQIEVSFMSDYLGETLISCPQIVLDIEG